MESTSNVFIDNIDYKTALKKYLENISVNPMFETVKTNQALHRKTKEIVFANISSPHYNSSAMDGIATIARKTNGASEINLVTLKLNEDFIYVNTGNQINDPYDCVIMIEDIIPIENNCIQITKPATPWQHVRLLGEDIVVGEMILPSNHKIRPMDIGALLAGGVIELNVYKKPKVSIIPTGSEIVSADCLINKGQIIDSNTSMLEAMVYEAGGIGRGNKATQDDYELLKSKVLSEVNGDNDIILINAGSSTGSKDFTVHIVEELGEVIIHGIGIKPGKPTILGIINNKPVIGLPGYPVSTYVTFESFVLPIINKFYNRENNSEKYITAKLTKKIVSSLKYEEHIRVKLGKINNEYVATPLSKGAGVTMSLVKADGFLTITREMEGVSAGEYVNIKCIKDISIINKTLVSIGSHDIVMDILSDKMHLSSSHLGSMGGIMALRREECHIAPIHLIDDNGEYNISYIKKYFQKRKVAIIKGVKRAQGFMVTKGNPFNIQTINDLTRTDVKFANRQNGSGTRMLLDYLLKKEKIDSSCVNGYNLELTTHMAVAVSVLNKTFTTGLGVFSAAKALNLDFVFLSDEEYDFILYEDELENPCVVEFIKILKSDAFSEIVCKLGGYDVSNCGEVLKNIDTKEDIIYGNSKSN